VTRHARECRYSGPRIFRCRDAVRLHATPTSRCSLCNEIAPYTCTAQRYVPARVSPPDVPPWPPAPTASDPSSRALADCPVGTCPHVRPSHIGGLESWRSPCRLGFLLGHGRVRRWAAQPSFTMPVMTVLCRIAYYYTSRSERRTCTLMPSRASTTRLSVATQAVLRPDDQSEREGVMR
jgi:hypothetical protein